MAEAHLHRQIRQFFEEPVERTGSQLFASFSHRAMDLAAQLPVLNIQQIRGICKAQEQTILEKVIPIKPYDLYGEIARVCPSERDICTISREEVAIRLNLYSSKLVLNEKISCESESEQSLESQEQSFFSEVQLDEMCMMKEELNPQEDTMRNIFDQCDNQPNSWSPNEYFGLN